MKKKAKLFLKKILLDKDISYVKLSEMMNNKGYKETPDTIRTKVHRGSYSFSFLLEVCDTLDIELLIKDK
jgi:transposase-like protein